MRLTIKQNERLSYLTKRSIMDQLTPSERKELKDLNDLLAYVVSVNVEDVDRKIMDDKRFDGR